ncbi:bifunctional proline dehydrogenase/L-glutamate gamma-semialdehyde dehydrogenase PutA [Anianabacter salinae]|uniref:bifunctional proline dehydrogenase/L-glutamate gamma-semialdehyde dehydrogenase PutA n=1 Tax=Anianabacter salinae TaxID=2851023 RepID=UPI00225E30A0|nr:bifunctional proline dehydrogenase/L-glutamate gamma-semialdehyde dehydrogenase PutA [Anianabacter salinae]MBV0911375.1 bifunctional proline dehydrogenase/L-glutamate gamma-semialdehyde dehydrogenase PutA [Anianabacter salinae]
MPRDADRAPRDAIDTGMYAEERTILDRLIHTAALSDADRAAIASEGARLVRRIRTSGRPGLMEVFLAEYGLSTEEGIALMCLAEALLRVPDAETIDALIEDKIAPSDWGKHLGHSSSSLVNASTWGLMLTGRVLEDPRPGLAGTLRSAMKRLGEPVIRAATGQAMREMGRQFVLGETIGKAMDRAAKQEARGYTYSYDMLGEAARTHADADRYHRAYADAIRAIGLAATHEKSRDNPGISVKFSALHPRYEDTHADTVIEQLVPRVLDLALMARERNMGLNVDAEEADRLSLSLDVIERVVADERLAGWDGFGIVVQAYGQRAGDVIDWINALGERLDRRFMVRLVKGAYWDTEIKRAQVMGVDGFPVFTTKPATDISYIANARKLLSMTDRIYPQFATHNAHTAAAILHMGADPAVYEFQRLHGMGERLHDILMEENATRCRIYAPVGAHKDLLAYLVRRLLENGANSSFVNQIVDEDVPPEIIAADPFDALPKVRRVVEPGPDLFRPERANAKGWDWTHRPTRAAIDEARGDWASTTFDAEPLIDGAVQRGDTATSMNPAVPGDTVGRVTQASSADVETALASAKVWDAPAQERAKVLNRAADLYEQNFGKLFAIASREAGKSIPDAVGELREAVDFLRYYAAQALALTRPPLGTVVCISPWNFPLAIFTGQIAGALAAGNAVIAKPAEQTPVIADEAVKLLHEAGVPRAVLQFLPGDGGTVGAALTSDGRVNGVAFTGSTETALAIRRAMADHMAPGTPLIAETGGLNAMIVDSTALPEQAVRDIVASSFQSAGQRCSALRCLYVQEDVADTVQAMLFGAMDALHIGDPWEVSTDVGPVIDAEAQGQIAAYVEAKRKSGKVLHELTAPEGGHFIAPVAVRVSGIEELEREVFGPVLHIATYKATRIDRVIDAINARGYGLTFGLHTRIDDRVQHITDRIRVGNTYVNRNQIGAIVGSQPFGGEGLSGTGPKAGGPFYVPRFTRPDPGTAQDTGGDATETAVQKALLAAGDGAVRDVVDLPGPTGESNRLTRLARLPILCLGPGPDTARAQRQAVEALGGRALEAAGLEAQALITLGGFSAAIWWGDADTARSLTQALAKRDGAIRQLITGQPTEADALLERHLCIDTTASGGNAELLAKAGSA